MGLSIAKDLGMAGGEALDKRARHLYGANCHGVSWHGGNPAAGLPPHAEVHLADGQDPAQAEALLAAIDKPTVEVAGLEITVNLGTLIVDDAETVVADPQDAKSVKVGLVKDDVSGSLEAIIYEKTTGEYGDTPAGKTHVAWLKEYTLPAAGNALTEVGSWL